MRWRDIACVLSTFLLAAPAFTETLVKPSGSRQVVFGDGKIGKALVLNGSSRLAYPSKFITANAGTVEMWVNPAESRDMSFLFSVGSNSPVWLTVTLDRREVAFSFSKKGVVKPDAYARVSAKAEVFKPNEWHHLAAAWGYAKPGECLVQLFIDGVLKDAAYNVTTPYEWGQGDFGMGIGHNTASVASKEGFCGRLDEVRISNYPKSPLEVEAAFKLGIDGKPLPCEEGTLLLMRFDDDTNAVSATQTILSQKDVEKRVQKSIEEEASR